MGNVMAMGMYGVMSRGRPQSAGLRQLGTDSGVISDAMLQSLFVFVMIEKCSQDFSHVFALRF